MRSVLIIYLLVIVTRPGLAQTHGFPFATVSRYDLELKTYSPDTAAIAVVLDEFGEAYIENGNHYNLIFRHHIKIKILKTGGLDYGNAEILLRKNGNNVEKLRSVAASTFNLENGKSTETQFNIRNIFVEQVNKYHDLKKFALPNVRVGSVVEIDYILETPFIHNFHKWEFQSEIPKVRSEYWTSIPGNYKYSIALRGYLTLTKNETSIIKACFTPGGDAKADCVQSKFAMANVPAFVTEEYMTAKSNFLAALDFELREIKYFDGRTDKITREWKDAEDELRRNPKFGIQLKRGEDVVDIHIKKLISGEPDALIKARKIYDFIKSWYRWDEVYGEYSEFGIKKAFENKVGNVGDINLSLIAALKYAGLDVEPILLSTRENGLVNELYPVLTEFDYVIAKLNLNNKVYLLDATDHYLPFGLLPERCLNGKGRVLGEKESYWFTLTAQDREKQMSVQNLVWNNEGMIHGTIQNMYFGYEAMQHRKSLAAQGGQAEYMAQLANRWHGVEIVSFTFENIDDLEKPLALKLEVKMDGNTSGANNILLNVFFLNRRQSNPFTSSERLYPVDFGAPIEEIVILNLELPADFDVLEIPERVGLSLPNSGGRYLFDVRHEGNKLIMSSSLLIGKTVFTSDEYHYLRELFARVVAVQNTDLLFKRKG